MYAGYVQHTHGRVNAFTQIDGDVETSRPLPVRRERDGFVPCAALTAQQSFAPWNPLETRRDQRAFRPDERSQIEARREQPVAHRDAVHAQCLGLGGSSDDGHRDGRESRERMRDVAPLRAERAG